MVKSCLVHCQDSWAETPAEAAVVSHNNSNWGDQERTGQAGIGTAEKRKWKTNVKKKGLHLSHLKLPHAVYLWDSLHTPPLPWDPNLLVSYFRIYTLFSPFLSRILWLGSCRTLSVCTCCLTQCACDSPAILQDMQRWACAAVALGSKLQLLRVIRAPVVSSQMNDVGGDE